jgi:AraC family transcriptional regulator
MSGVRTVNEGMKDVLDTRTSKFGNPVEAVGQATRQTEDGLAAQDAPALVPAVITRITGARPSFLVRSIGGRGLFAAKWHLPRHKTALLRLPESVLCYHAGGSAVITKVTQAHRVRRSPRPGSLTFAPADAPTEWSVDGPLDVVHVYISPAAVGDFAAEHLEVSSAPRIEDFFGIEDPWLAGYFQMLVSDCELYDGTERPADSLFLGETEHTLVRHLLRWHGDAGTGGENTLDAQARVNPLRPLLMRRVQDYIETNLANDIELKTLADIARMSVDHFLRSFRAAAGTTPHRYLLEKRLGEACAMLRNGTAPIGTIATVCGFKSSSHFTVAFQGHFGVTPSKYRRSL